MKLIQKILSHGLLLAFVAAAFFAYTNRTEWFPQWFGKTGKAAQQLTTDVQPDVSAPEVVENTRVQPAPAVPEKQVLESAPLHATAKPDVVLHVVKPVLAEPAQAPVNVVPDSVMLPEQADTTTALEKAEPVASAETGVVPVPVGSDAQIQAMKEQLEEARQRYWQGDLRGAAAAYHALAGNYPENPDVWGEIGNFHFSLHRREPAAEAYSRCVELLVHQGEQVRARQLLDILYRLDAHKAHELEAKMQQSGG